jgi:hypothetical protein
MAISGKSRSVELYELAAGRALAAHLVALIAVQERDEQPDHGRDETDGEPDQERRAPDPADGAGHEAKPRRDQQVDHSLRTIQTAA